MTIDLNKFKESGSINYNEYISSKTKEFKKNIKGTDTWIDIYEKLSRIKDKELREVILNTLTEQDNSTLSATDKRKIQAKFTYEKVKKDLNSVKNLSEIPPLFLKPAYFLQQATPYVSGVIKVSEGEVSGKMEIPLCSPEEDTNNIIKSFEYDVNGNKAIIIVGNAEEYVVEYLAMKIGTLMAIEPPMVELEFGWASPKPTITSDLTEFSNFEIETKEYQNLISRVTNTAYFRKKFLAIIENMEVSYEQDGSITLTITCQKDLNFPPPLHDFNPYDILGKKPAVVLQQIQTLQQLAYYFSGFATGKDDSYFITEGQDGYTLIKSIIEYFYFYKQIKNISNIHKVIVATQQFFRPDLADRFKSKSKLITTIQQYAKTLIKTDKKVWTQVSANKIKASNKKEVPLTSSKTILDNASKKIITAKVGNNKELLIIKSFLKNYDGNLIQTHLNIREELKKTGPNKPEKITNKSEKVIPNYYVYLKKLYIALTPLLDEALIHPYAVLVFCKEMFKEQLRVFKEKAKVKYLQNKDDATAKQIYLTYHQDMLGFDREMVAGYTQGVSAKKQAEANNVEFYNYENEKYLKKSGSVAVLQPSSGWSGLFSLLASQMYIWIKKSEYESTTKSKAGKEFDKQRKIENVDKSEDKQALLRTVANCKIAHRDEALSSLKVFKTIMEDRQKFNKSIGDKNFETATLSRISEAIETIKNVDQDSMILLTIFDSIPGIDQIFDPMRGKQSIYQAYSVRGGGYLNQDDQGNSRFNIGFPSVNQINFPDVLSFTPKFDLRANINNINTSTKSTSAELKTVKSELIYKISKYDEELKTLKGDKNKSKREAIEKKKASAESDINILNDSIKIKDIYTDGKEFKRPVEMIFPNRKNKTEITKAVELQEKRKYMQEYRKKGMLFGAGIEVDMEVLGDPVFDFNSVQKYLFIRRNNNDGSDSIFTGIYYIKTIKHKISAGVFTTSFELMKDPSINEDTAKQIKQIAYYSDNI